VHPVLINISLVVLDEQQIKLDSKSKMETYVKGGKHFYLLGKKPNVLPPKE
jgi:hypothetical protein